jgi:hypothetical protein
MVSSLLYVISITSKNADVKHALHHGEAGHRNDEVGQCDLIAPGLIVGSAATRVLGHERQRLAIEPGERHDRADEVSGVEIEGHNVVLPYAVQASAWTESQSPGPDYRGY